MEFRLGDLYELIVRIVDDRLKQWQEKAKASENGMAVKASLTPSKVSEPSPEGQAILQKLQELVTLQQQLLAILQRDQQLNEAKWEEVIGLLKQVLEQRERDSQTLTPAPSFEPSRPSPEPLPTSEPPKASPTQGAKVEAAVLTEAKVTTVPSMSVALSPTAAATPSPPFISPPSSVSPTDASPSSATSPPNWADWLIPYLLREWSIQVNFLRERPLPINLPKGKATLLVGEGTQEGQGLTLVVLVTEEVTPADVSLFHETVVKPLRDAIAEPVIGLIVGRQFDPKVLRIAPMLNCVLIRMDEVRPTHEPSGAAGL
jgi:hypothetical protein